MSTTNLKDEFNHWMKDQKKRNGTDSYSPHTIYSYVNSLSSEPPKLKGLPENMPNLYEITNAKEFEKLVEMIKRAPNYEEVNQAAANQAFHYGMAKYLEFLTQRHIPISSHSTTGKNIILYGPPGTGKTYDTTVYAVAAIEDVPYCQITDEIQKQSYEVVRNRFDQFTASGQIMFTTFHQSYSYEEFIEGIKPVMQDTEETLTYELKKGLFQEFCDQARKHSDQHYVFIIDEINRGNISKIFGELITLIEPSKRLGQREEITLQLPYSQNTFGVPSNVTILATMNTADRSIARLDSALRRRFQFIELLPNPALLESIALEQIDFKALLHKINTRIEALYDREHTIGHAYFMPLLQDPTMERLADLFKNAIIPLLQEYFYEDYEMIQLILGDYGKDTALQFIKERSIHPIDLFGTTLPTHMEEKTLYEINDAAFLHPAAYRSIYE